MVRTVLIFFLLVLSVDGWSTCGAPSVDAPEDHIIPSRFVYEKGWQIPGLTEAVLTDRHTNEFGIEVLKYKPKNAVTVDLQGFDVEPAKKTVRIVPGYNQYVMEISELRVNGRTFGYDLMTVSTGQAHPAMWPSIRIMAKHEAKAKHAVSAGVLGCGFTVIRYFDNDGDGVFESMQYSGFGGSRGSTVDSFTTPDWAIDLIPNKAAWKAAIKKRAYRWSIQEFPLPAPNPAIPVLKKAPQS